jgi:hypothetical protein
MCSERQILANQLNAQRSTGPRTSEGKAKVAVNALKHGLTARDIVLPNEDPNDFDTFRVELLSSLAPHGALESLFADAIVAYAWRLRRIERFEAALYKRGCAELLARRAEELVTQYESTEKDRVLASLEDKKVAARDREAHADAEERLVRARAELDNPAFNPTRVLEMYPELCKNLERHEAALSRSMLRMLHELERLQAKRSGQYVPVPAVVDVDLSVSEPAGAEIGGIGNGVPDGNQQSREGNAVD